jgi:hypothetical protein
LTKRAGAFVLTVPFFPKAAISNKNRKGRSSDSLHLLQPSHRVKTVAIAGNKRLFLKHTASGNVRDSHPVPFSFLGKQETIAAANVGKNLKPQFS